MRRGLVLEGGAMRGMYTAGVLDVMMEHHISVDGVIGVSAGAVFGCNYKSGQIGRAIRYNMKYCRDPRYMSVRSLLRTGDLYGVDFCYHELPEKLDPFDQKAFCASPVEFYAVCTDVTTGKPVYHSCARGDAGDLDWMRASASMPIASRVVEIEGRGYLDGGISDSIPYAYFQKIGYDRNIVVLTRPAGYQKKKTKLAGLMNTLLRHYPEIAKAMDRRSEMYNQELAGLAKQEAEGRVLVIRPSRNLKVKRTEKDPQKLKQLYELGRQDTLRQLKKIEAFLKKE